jgi:hypothetical protein
LDAVGADLAQKLIDIKISDQLRVARKIRKRSKRLNALRLGAAQYFSPRSFRLTLAL